MSRSIHSQQEGDVSCGMLWRLFLYSIYTAALVTSQASMTSKVHIEDLLFLEELGHFCGIDINPHQGKSNKMVRRVICRE